MSNKEVICFAECPACGEELEFTELGKLPCSCGMEIGELAVNWEIVEDKDNAH